jgi:hypothetical protein
MYRKNIGWNGMGCYENGVDTDGGERINVRGRREVEQGKLKRRKLR